MPLGRGQPPRAVALGTLIAGRVDPPNTLDPTAQCHSREADPVGMILWSSAWLVVAIDPDWLSTSLAVWLHVGPSTEQTAI